MRAAAQPLCKQSGKGGGRLWTSAASPTPSSLDTLAISRLAAPIATPNADSGMGNTKSFVNRNSFDTPNHRKYAASGGITGDHRSPLRILPRPVVGANCVRPPVGIIVSPTIVFRGTPPLSVFRTYSWRRWERGGLGG